MHINKFEVLLPVLGVLARSVSCAWCFIMLETFSCGIHGAVHLSATVRII